MPKGLSWVPQATGLLLGSSLDQSSVVPYSTDNHSKQRAKLEGEKHLHRKINSFKSWQCTKQVQLETIFLSIFVQKPFSIGAHRVDCLQWRLKLCNLFKKTRSLVFYSPHINIQCKLDLLSLGKTIMGHSTKANISVLTLNKPPLHPATKRFLLALSQH